MDTARGSTSAPVRVRRFRRPLDDRRDTAWLVTVCAALATPALAEVVDGRALLTGTGLQAAAAWLDIPISNPHVSVDAWCVVPDQLHGVLWIEDPRGTPIDEVVRRFKAHAARRMRAGEASGAPVWCADHRTQALRSSREVAAARAWVESSPRRWEARQTGIAPPGRPSDERPIR